MCFFFQVLYKFLYNDDVMFIIGCDWVPTPNHTVLNELQVTAPIVQVFCLIKAVLKEPGKRSESFLFKSLNP